MRLRQRTAYTLLAALLLLCALAAILYLRQKAPPEAARLLPESDAIVFLNLKPLRFATRFDRNPVTPSPAYQQFIDATGIVLERDLDSAAFAVHRMSDPTGPNGPAAFSEVFIGRFDRPRLSRYLASVATSQETYAGRTIYSIPSNGYTDRVALLSYDIVAASNAPTPEQIHSILDRQRAAASPFAGSSLLNDRFSEIPILAKDAWAIGHIGLPFSQNGRISVMGLELPLPADATFIASLHYTTGLHRNSGALALQIDEIAASDADAAHSASALNTLLNLFRGLQPEPRTASDAALRQFTDSIVIRHHADRATLTATIPPEALKHLTNP